jgi:NADPH2:quinone reductase
MMRALCCHRFAPIGEQRIESRARPEPAAGQVLIRVAAAGVNFYDGLIVQGKYQIQPKLPFSPGGEVAGIVEAVGEGVANLVPGDRVCAFIVYGGYAEYALAPVERCWHLPDAVPFRIAAAGLVTGATAWFALMDLARVSSSDTVLVLGAAGGVGLAAIQIAARAGARVIAAAGDAQRLQLCHEAGAGELIDYRREDLRQALRKLAPRGVDIALDVVGGDKSDAVLRAMSWRGRYLVVGFASGEIPALRANLVLLKGCQVLGVEWNQLLQREPDNARSQLERLFDAWSNGELLPTLIRLWPLEQAVDALRALAERRSSGKQILIATEL